MDADRTLLQQIRDKELEFLKQIESVKATTEADIAKSKSQAEEQTRKVGQRQKSCT